MNYLALCKRLRSECGVQGDGPSAVTSQTGMYAKLVEWVSDAYTEIQAMPLDWNWLRAVLDLAVQAGVSQYTPGTAPWNTPADAARIREFDDRNLYLVDGAGNRSRVRVLTYTEFLRDYPNVTTPAARPSFLTMTPWGRVDFSSVPDQSYTLKAGVRLKPQVLSSDSDTPAMPEEFHLAIVHRAKMKFATQRGDRALLADAQADWKRMFMTLAARCTPSIEYKATPPE